VTNIEREKTKFSSVQQAVGQMFSLESEGAKVAILGPDASAPSEVPSTTRPAVSDAGLTPSTDNRGLLDHGQSVGQANLTQHLKFLTISIFQYFNI